MASLEHYEKFRVDLKKLGEQNGDSKDRIIKAHNNLRNKATGKFIIQVFNAKGIMIRRILGIEEESVAIAKARKLDSNLLTIEIVKLCKRY